MYPALHCIVTIACQRSNQRPQSWSFGNTILNLVRSILILCELTDLKVTEVLVSKLIIIIIKKKSKNSSSAFSLHSKSLMVLKVLEEHKKLSRCLEQFLQVWSPHIKIPKLGGLFSC